MEMDYVAWIICGDGDLMDLETGIVEGSSRIGIYLQNRTKGTGKGSVSRAYYLRPLFMKQLIPIHISHCLS